MSILSSLAETDAQRPYRTVAVNVIRVSDPLSLAR
jgi:hypothetical protein